MSNLIELKKFFQTHWLAILLVALGSWLRFTQLPEKGILFGDSGRDLLVAAQAIENKEIPLLGIPSSIPRFHQGPLTIWLSMVIYQLFGFKPIFFYWTFALIGCLSLLAIYEFSILTLNRKTGLIALAFLAVSPLAIAHSRMPYHTVPIALTTIIALWALTRVVERKKASLAVATFAVSLVFQHELSLFPLFLAIPICWWWGGILKNQAWLTAARINLKEIYLAGFALILGVLPQLLSEIKDGSHQLSGFVLWLGYRILSFFLPSSQHFGMSTFFTGIQTSLMYWTRIFFVPDNKLTSILMIGLVILTIAGWVKLSKKIQTIKDFTPGIGVTLLTTILITAGYLMHGAPSEAYFPVYTILWPLIIAIGFSNLTPLLKKLSSGWLVLCMLVAVTGIYRNNFWVDQNFTWNYGPSVGSQIKSLIWAAEKTGQNQLTLTSSDPDSQFSNYLDNYVWLSRSLNLAATSLAGNKFPNQTHNQVLLRSQNLNAVSQEFTGQHFYGQKFRLESKLVQPASTTEIN